MPKERLKSPRARLFVALDLPGGVLDEIARWQGTALADPALRPMRPESMHVTLCFLSHQPEKAIPRIAERIASVGARSVELGFDPEPSAIPKGRPRLYAIGGRSESATALQAELSEALAAEGFYEPEKRGFWPHVTVARVRSERLPRSVASAGAREGHGASSGRRSRCQRA